MVHSASTGLPEMKDHPIVRTRTNADSRCAPSGARTTATAVVGLLLALGAVGCIRNTPAALTPSRVYYDLIPVTSLASRLGMQVGRTSRYSVAMNGGTNSLLIMAPPRPMVILNGQRIGDGRGVAEQDGQVMVERELAWQISRQLKRRPTRPRPVAPAGPVVVATGATVVLDAGHGGKDPGAPNRYGPTESILVMDATHRISQLLRKRNVRVILTRSDDTFVELNDRADIANRAGADLFVSIHADSHPTGTIDGFTIYTARKPSKGAEALAATAARSLKGQVPTFRGVRRQDFRVLVRTEMPAILIELGYLTNRAEATKLSTPACRQRLAEAIADGIVRYFNSRSGPDPPGGAGKPRISHEAHVVYTLDPPAHFAPLSICIVGFAQSRRANSHALSHPI